MSKNAKEWIIFIAIAIVLAIVISMFIRPTIVKQKSMEPTFQSGDYIFVSKQAYTLFEKPEYKDVIIFKSHIEAEDGNDKLLIKRVIGVPGDTIQIKDGFVYRNGEKLDEDYVFQAGVTEAKGDDPNNQTFTVPEDSVFVMGDNRAVSVDSRSVSVGFVSVKDIYGKVFLRLYPFDRIATF